MLLLVGVIASLSGFAATALLRQRRCSAEGGVWRQAEGCRLPSGETIDVTMASDVVTGVVVTVALGFMLFRVLLFALRRAGQTT